MKKFRAVYEMYDYNGNTLAKYVVEFEAFAEYVWECAENLCPLNYSGSNICWKIGTIEEIGHEETRTHFL